MKTNKIMGRNIRLMADECCQKVVGCRLSRYDWAIICDSYEDAANLLIVLSDANRYWQSVGKPSKAECAYKCMGYVHDMLSVKQSQIPKLPRYGKVYIDTSSMQFVDVN